MMKCLQCCRNSDSNRFIICWLCKQYAHPICAGIINNAAMHSPTLPKSVGYVPTLTCNNESTINLTDLSTPNTLTATSSQALQTSSNTNKADLTMKALQQWRRKGFWLSSGRKCSINHRVDDIIASIEKQIAALSQPHHKNLTQYECVHCTKEALLVYLVHDFVLATSDFSISSSLGRCMDGVKGVAKGVLDSLTFLHSKDVSHSHLLDSSVFMDYTGTIRCSNFTLVINLLDFIGGSGERSTQGYLPALGALVDILMTTTHQGFL
uniref:Protein kinase domain-containing protein n=1 Tax=Glossina brevipalpis TaxID=37001 RepID=A0A1A9WNU3_9MUSC